MARPIFYPTNDSLVVGPTGVPFSGSPVRIWTAQTGGSQVTDLQYVDAAGTSTGAVPGGVLYSDGDGLIPAFAGPDGGPVTLWGDHGFRGHRLALTSSPVGGGGGGAGVTGTGGGAVTSTAAIASDAALTGTYGPVTGSDAWLKAWGSNIDSLIRATTITRDGNEAATGASVIWPDGTAGTYTGTASTGTPGAIDSYTATYAGSTTKTVTQPTMTRNAAGSVTNRPAMVVS